MGQGTQDLGFRSEVDILFTIAAVGEGDLPRARLERQADHRLVSDQRRRQRVYPSQTKRLAPDFFFHPQVYRADGESVALPPGEYTIEYSRGPEYRKSNQNASRRRTTRRGHLRSAWSDGSIRRRMGWYSGDHHIHAAGCAHYERPTEGVYPQDMMRHMLGEDLKIGSVLTLGAGLVFPEDLLRRQGQRGLHAGQSDALRRGGLRLPVEPHGPSAAARLKEQDYPGTKRIEDWPSWGLPILQWAKKQGAVDGLRALGLGPGAEGGEAAQRRDAALRRHRRERVRRGVTHGAGGFHLHGGHAVCMGAEHLVSHAQRRLPHAHQRRDGFPVHLWRARGAGPQLCAAGASSTMTTGWRDSGRAATTRPTARATDRFPGERCRDGLAAKMWSCPPVDGESDGESSGVPRRAAGRDDPQAALRPEAVLGGGARAYRQLAEGAGGSGGEWPRRGRKEIDADGKAARRHVQCSGGAEQLDMSADSAVLAYKSGLGDRGKSAGAGIEAERPMAARGGGRLLPPEGGPSAACPSREK